MAFEGQIAAHAGAQTGRTTDTAEPGQFADAIAKRIAQFAADQAWIQRTASK
jgi:hypothetical protein